MDPFAELRKLARRRRKSAIAQAEADFAAIMERIDALERDITGIMPAKRHTLATCVEQVLPNDSTFTMPDIMGKLAQLDPDRVWSHRAVINHLAKLKRRELIRRVKPAQGRNPAVYVREGVPYDPIPFEDMTLKEVVAAVLTERGPSRDTDLAVAILDAGYQSKMKGKRFAREVTKTLQSNPARFQGDDDVWDVAGKK